MIEFFFEPFLLYDFMRRALYATVLLSIAAAPFGVFLMLRRMSLTSDAMSHALLPGVAIAYSIAGYSIYAMAFGAFIAGCAVAFLSTVATRLTHLQEDTSLASFYLMSLALGVLLISSSDSQTNLTHILFGSVLSADREMVMFILIIVTLASIGLLIILKWLILDSVDPLFLRAHRTHAGLIHSIFMGLLVAILVAGYQSLGTLMCIGLLVLPAASSRFWSHKLRIMFLIAASIGAFGSYLGLVFSINYDLPPGPAIIMVLSIAYLASLLFGATDGLITTRLKWRHLEG